MDSPAADAYRAYVQDLVSTRPDEAMAEAVGGDFVVTGTLERELLRSVGLQPSHRVVDLGCGSGRLASALAGYLSGDYLGIDVVADLLEHARSVSPPDWQFELVDDPVIPAPDESVDVVCAFSLFTHVRHEVSYAYLAEAHRVLIDGGIVVMSFLEYSCPRHWSIFLRSVAGTTAVPMAFLERATVETWAEKLGLQVTSFSGCDDRTIELAAPLRRDDGTTVESPAGLGQSVAVLTKGRSGAGRTRRRRLRRSG